MDAMPNIAELVKAHRLQLGWSQAELARRVGTTQQNISRIEKGQIAESGDLPVIFHVLQIDHNVLVARQIPQKQLEERRVSGYYGKNLPDIGIFGAISKGEVFSLTTEAIESVSRPTPLSGVQDGYGVYIVDSSMAPEFEQGDIAFFHPHSPPRADNSCIFYCDKPGGQVAMIRRLVRITRDAWHVQQWNPPHGETKDHILRRSEWQKVHMTVGKYSRR